MSFHSSLKNFLHSGTFIVIHIISTILALLVYLFHTNEVAVSIINIINIPIILHAVVILYTLMSFWIFVQNFHLINSSNTKTKLSKLSNTLKDVLYVLLVAISYFIVFILDYNGKFMSWFVPSILIITVSILLFLVNRHRLGKLFYYDFKKKYTDRFSTPILEQLLNLKGLNFIKNEIRFLHNIQLKQDDPNKPENLMHIAYNSIFNTNHTLSKLNEVDLIASNSPKNLQESFQKSLSELKTFRNYNDAKSFAWYVSLINPKEWLSDEWKKNYFKPFLSTIYNKNSKENRLNVDIRRIRIITKEDFDKNDEALFEIMFIEHLYGINSRVLIVDKDIIKYEDDAVFETISDIPLLDYCILYKSSIKYFQKDHQSKVTLCSDIKPYYIEETSKENKVYLLTDLYIFNELYEHFMLLWNFNDFASTKKPKKILNTPKLTPDDVIFTFNDLIRSPNFSIIKSNLTHEKIKKLFEAFLLNNASVPSNMDVKQFEKKVIDKIETVFTSWVSNSPASENEIQNILRTDLDSIFFKEIKYTQNEF